MAFDAFALILTMLALGMVFARLRAFPDNAGDVINRVVLYVCLPAAMLTYVPRLRLDTSLMGVVVTPWLLTVATVALVALATRVLNFRRDEHAVLLLCVALCNSSFIGYPMVRALLGEHALPYAVVYDQFGTFILLSTFGLYVLARYGGDAPPTAREIAAHREVPAGVGVAVRSDADAGTATGMDRRRTAKARRRHAAAGDAGGRPDLAAETAAR